MTKKLPINKKINGLWSATAEMIYETDMQHGDGREYWPYHPVILDYIVAPFVFNELYRILKILEKRGYSLKQIANLFKSPTRIANYQYLWPSPTLKSLSNTKKYYLARTFIKLLDFMRHNEPFCEKRRNLVWSDYQIKNFLEKNKKYLVKRNENPEIAKILAKLEGLIMSYSELLYYYMIDFSRMVHGPYNYKNKVIFIKEFLDLKAGEMWDLVKDFPFSHFQEIGIYPTEMHIEVFFMGHSHTNFSFPEALEAFVLKIDGKPVTTLTEIERIYNETDKVVSRAVKFVSKNMKKDEFLFKRGLDLFFYPLKPFYEEIGEDWRIIMPEVYKFGKKMRSNIKIPNPWGEWSKEKAATFLTKKMDFRKKHLVVGHF